MHGRTWLVVACVAINLSLLAGAQAPAPAAPRKPAFDVVSIKPSVPNPDGPIRVGGGARGNRWIMSNATLRMLLQTAYRPPSEGPGQLQIINPPGWLEADRFDVEGTVDCGGGMLASTQIPLMVQSMLEDRFQLRAHLETRELAIYNLVVGRDGPKINASADQTPPNAGRGPLLPCAPVPDAPAPAPPPPPPPPAPGGRGGPLDPNFVMPRGATLMMVSSGTQTVRSSAVGISTLIGFLQQQLGRPVVDKTGLTGLFDYTLQFSREGLPGSALAAGPPPAAGLPGATGVAPDAPDPVPSLFTAVQELGLRLESARGPVNVLVIESVQKPTPN
jgi:uncharacterized protein (TIGR03435 family)